MSMMACEVCGGYVDTDQTADPVHHACKDRWEQMRDAAPDLLAACRGFLKTPLGQMSEGPSIDAMRAAIAKAEGKL